MKKNNMIYFATFYQVRFMNENILPLSICSGEPSWFHDGKDRSYVFTDKRNVVNGLIATPLCLSSQTAAKIDDMGGMCSKHCQQDKHHCLFKDLYYSELINKDINEILKYLEEVKRTYKRSKEIKGDVDIALLVYEQPDNICSEREVVKRYLNEHNIETREYSQDLVDKEILF